MRLTMPVVFDERHRGHAPGAGIWLGVTIPGDEEPERGDALGDALRAAGSQLRPATDHGDEPLLRVHDADFVAYLEVAHRRWVEEGHLEDPGQPLVVPYERCSAGSRSRPCSCRKAATCSTRSAISCSRRCAASRKRADPR